MPNSEEEALRKSADSATSCVGHALAKACLSKDSAPVSQSKEKIETGAIELQSILSTRKVAMGWNFVDIFINGHSVRFRADSAADVSAVSATVWKQIVKEVLVGPLLLAHYDPNQTLSVAADASPMGVGGVLLQHHADGNEKAVFHMAKPLTKTRRNYSQIEKEALALVTAVERFRKFLLGRRFILQTDFGEPTQAKPFIVVVDSSSKFVDAQWMLATTSKVVISYLQLLFRFRNSGYSRK